MPKKKVRKAKAKRKKAKKNRKVKRKATKRGKKTKRKALKKGKKAKRKAGKKKGKTRAAAKPTILLAATQRPATASVRGPTLKAVGKVIHYYDRIGVGIVELKQSLRIGEKIRVQKGTEEFDQTVESMEVDHQPVAEARRGDVIGLKINQKIKEGAVVMKA